MFSQKFLKASGFLSCQVTGRFPSKKNNLYLLTFTCPAGSKKQFVYKLFNYRNKMIREAEMLFMLKKSTLPVPSLFKVVGNGILTEFVSGPTLLNYFSWQEKSCQQNKKAPYLAPALRALDYLAAWLQDFYEITESVYGKKMILGNINASNFIINKQLYGLDFESCTTGEPEEDAGRLCAFTLTSDPACTLWKKALVKKMLKHFLVSQNLNRERLSAVFCKEIEAISIRRGLRLSYSQVENMFGLF